MSVEQQESARQESSGLRTNTQSDQPPVSIVKTPLLHLISISLSIPMASVYAQGDKVWAAAGGVTISLVETWSEEALLQKDEEGNLISEQTDGQSYRIPTFENQFSTSTGNRFIETYEYGSKIGTYRIGNRQILEQMLADELLDGSTSIRGWSIVALYNDVSYGTEGSNEKSLPTFYARHTGTRMIEIEDFVITPGLGVDRTSIKEVTTTTSTEEDERINTSYSFSSSFRQPFELAASAYWGTIQGVLSGSTKYAARRDFYIDEVYDEIRDTIVEKRIPETYDLLVPGTLKLDKMVSKPQLEEQSEEGTSTDEPESMFEGSITVGLPRVVELSIYLGEPAL